MLQDISENKDADDYDKMDAICGALGMIKKICFSKLVIRTLPKSLLMAHVGYVTQPCDNGHVTI